MFGVMKNIKMELSIKVFYNIYTNNKSFEKFYIVKNKIRSPLLRILVNIKRKEIV